MVINNIDKRAVLKKIFYIYYLIQFLEDKIRALLNSDNKINIINLEYAQNLGFITQKTYIRA